MSTARLILLSVLVGCAPGPGDRPHPAAQDFAPTRIISLAPHLTELTFAAGAGPRLVGVVAHSDFPAAAREIPGIGDAFNLDFERIAELEPDLVLAWAGGTPASVLQRLVAMGLQVRLIETRTLDDIPARLLELADLAGAPELAAMRAGEYRRRLADLARERLPGPPVAVFYQISLQPLYTVGGGHFITEMIELCGGRNVFADLESPAAAVGHEAVLQRDPELILVGQPWLDETRLHWQRFVDNDGRVQLAPIDPDLVTRPGLRLARGAEQICAHIRAQRSGLAGVGP